MEGYDFAQQEAVQEQLAFASDPDFHFGFNDQVQEDLVGRLTTWDAVRTFIYAGNATFTIRSMKTGVRFTYRCKKLKKVTQGSANIVHFLGLLRGPDNDEDYAYMGCILDESAFKITGKSRVKVDAASMKAWRWVFDEMNSGRPMHNQLEVWHEGRCGRCGRKLTVPESIDDSLFNGGFGPECVHYV